MREKAYLPIKPIDPTYVRFWRIRRLRSQGAAMTRAHPTEKGDTMEIATAIQRGSTVYAYDMRGIQLFSTFAGSGQKDGLVGFTSTSVSIRRGDTMYVYNARGSLRFSTFIGTS